MGDKNYKILKFPVNQFIKFTGQPKNNYYQIKKLVEFLKSLSKMEPIIDNFSDDGFQSYVDHIWKSSVKKVGGSNRAFVKNFVVICIHFICLKTF